MRGCIKRLSTNRPAGRIIMRILVTSAQQLLIRHAGRLQQTLLPDNAKHSKAPTHASLAIIVLLVSATDRTARLLQP